LEKQEETSLPRGVFSSSTIENRKSKIENGPGGVKDDEDEQDAKEPKAF
jgi:hypothetical protein